MNTPKIVIPLEASSGGYDLHSLEPSEMTWPDIQKIWKSHSIDYPICFAPPEDRLEMFFFYACQHYGTPCSLGTVYNPSWTDMFLSQVKHDCIIITAPLILYLLSNNLFSKHMPHFRLLISIGAIDDNIQKSLQDRFPNLRYEVLPHPIGSYNG